MIFYLIISSLVVAAIGSISYLYLVPFILKGALFPAPAPDAQYRAFKSEDGYKRFGPYSYCSWWSGPIVNGVGQTVPFVAPNKAPLIVFYLHGNGENIVGSQHILDRIENSQTIKGQNILYVTPEYTGYAPHDYKQVAPSHQGAIDACRAILSHVMNANPQSKVVLIGRSIGTGVLSQFLKDIPIDRIQGLAFISAFRSIQSLVIEKAGRVGSIVASDVLDSELAMKSLVKRATTLGSRVPPTLFIHGRDDDLIPVQHSVQLQKLIPGSRLEIIVGDHNSISFATLLGQFIQSTMNN